MTVDKSIKWVMAKSGRAVEVKVSVTREMVANGIISLDGHQVQVKGSSLQESQTVIAYLDGVEIEHAYMGEIQHIKPTTVNGLRVIATIGRTVALTEERTQMIEAAIHEAIVEAETDPEVAAYRAAEAKHNAAVSRAEKHIADVEDMMTLGGHTY